MYCKGDINFGNGCCVCEHCKQKISDILGYTMIYNPLGCDSFKELDNNIVFVTGKPSWLNAYNLSRLIILNSDLADIKWLHKNIKPMTVANDVKIEYR